ncbi:hypothetical protein [Cyanobium sp. CH-040]|uniref:hypothetical protein n=1 Tax=Cyanobium sp. CH-040 TaxID=2823708 RepID=UPI0020CC597A|nr:hypothetical protein [Cyanobium sp. CH-040]MCP9927921.1 hypothetical protein [Cyanobium sp. CH-040]
MRIALPLALATAAAFSTHTLPVRAYPGPSVNLVRIDAEGVKPLPDVTRLLSEAQAQVQAQAQAPTAAPAAGPGGPASPAAAAPLPTNLTWLLSPGDELEISFRRPLPAGATGVVVLREAPAPADGLIGPGEPGREVERIPFPSTQVFLSEERTFMAIQPQTPRPPGTITTVQFELGPRVVPEPETPVRFALAQPAVARERKASPCPFTPLPGAQAAQAATTAATGAAAAGAASWVLPAILGFAALAAGAAIISASGNDGGNNRGGRNPVSR